MTHAPGHTTPSAPPTAPPPPADSGSDGPPSVTPIGVPSFLPDFDPETGQYLRDEHGRVLGKPFMAEVVRPNFENETLTGFRPELRTTKVAPRYFTGDEHYMFSSYPASVLARIQLRMEEAGLLDPNKYAPGRWIGDDKGETLWAMREVLGYANQNGIEWEDALDQLAAFGEELRDRGGDGPAYPGFAAPAYVSPDYATLAQTVKSTVRGVLGRDPEEWELTLLADELSTFDRAEYDSQLAEARAQYEAQKRADLTGEDTSAGTVQGVDAMSRFKEKFEELYAPEIQAEEGEDEAETNTALLMRSITGVDSVIGD